MGILPFVAARTPDGAPVTWSGPLAAVVLGSHITVDDWVRYRTSGTVPEGLPDGLPVVTLRPIGAGREVEACEVEAGPPESYGGQLLAWLAESTPKDSPDRARQLAKLIDQQPTDERVAMQRHQHREQRLVRARLARALVAVDGEALIDVGTADVPRLVAPIDAIDELPDLVRRCALAELADHLERISGLSAEGKARAGRA